MNHTVIPQFSSPSQYNIDVYWSNDLTNDDLTNDVPSETRSLLSNISDNKANGPDFIDGHILIHCV